MLPLDSINGVYGVNVAGKLNVPASTGLGFEPFAGFAVSQSV
jgi:hypothetical protein